MVAEFLLTDGKRVRDGHNWLGVRVVGCADGNDKGGLWWWVSDFRRRCGKGKNGGYRLQKKGVGKAMVAGDGEVAKTGCGSKWQ